MPVFSITSQRVFISGVVCPSFPELEVYRAFPRLDMSVTVHVRDLHSVVVTLVAEEKVLPSRPLVTLARRATLVCTCCIAVSAQGVALLQQAHVCTKFHQCFQHSRRQLNSSARSKENTLYGCKPFGSYSHLVTNFQISLPALCSQIASTR